MTTTPVPTQTVCILYTTLSAVDFFVVIFSLLLIYGNERTDESKLTCYFLPWLLWVPIYVLYESAINIFYFVQQFNGGVLAPLTMGDGAFAIVPLVYWVVKTILLIIGYMVVFKRAQTIIQCCTPYLYSSGPTYIARESPYMAHEPTYVTREPTYIRTTHPPSCGCGCAAKIVTKPAPVYAPAILQAPVCGRGCGGQCGKTCSNFAAPSPYNAGRTNYGPASPTQFQLYGGQGRGFWQ